MSTPSSFRSMPRPTFPLIEFWVILLPVPEITATPVNDAPLSVTTLPGPIVFWLPRMPMPASIAPLTVLYETAFESELTAMLSPLRVENGVAVGRSSADHVLRRGGGERARSVGDRDPVVADAEIGPARVGRVRADQVPDDGVLAASRRSGFRSSRLRSRCRRSCWSRHSSPRRRRPSRRRSALLSAKRPSTLFWTTFKLPVDGERSRRGAPRCCSPRSRCRRRRSTADDRVRSELDPDARPTRSQAESAPIGRARCSCPR